MSNELWIMIGILFWSVAGGIYLVLDLRRRLKDPVLLARVLSRNPPGGLKAVKAYYWVGIVCSAIMIVFCLVQIKKML